MPIVDFNNPSGAGYAKLVERELYIEWESLPKSLRVPDSQAKLAKQLGVSERTIQVWKKDPRIAAQVTARTRAGLSIDSYATVMDTLKVQATDPSNPRSVQAAKLLLEQMERAEVLGAAEVPLKDKSPDELKAMVAQLYDAIDVEAS